ncbi:RHS repeat domain-containing protein [Anoxybacillus sp. CHMUD]|uniref:RHS repeat domain-containing protein n=1 Tax=Anoxybacillus sp. CHMUD TaxID=2508870 RepID=UPI002738E229|nr:RHS repeat-associated core domain-containing protein [Anoxybacillus sp. CHMUD]
MINESFHLLHDERGNVRTFTTGNGAGSTFTYDDRGLVESVSVGTADGNEIVSETYRYDENGNRTKIESPTGEAIVYRYDALDQLVEEQWPDGTTIEYTYDGFGNRKQIVKTKDGQSATTTADYNAANQLVRFGDETITYDANGNRLEDGQYQYEWNAADQLVSITRKGESTPFATYQYDEDGRRIQKTVNGVVTNYHYQGDSLNVLYETDASGSVVRSYVYSADGQRLAMKQGGVTYFYHYNAHGDVIALTDAQGNIVARYQYDAWGNILSQSGALADENPYRYAGYQYDQETGLYYLIARYYRPEQGVFLSLDPDPGDADDILTQNGYTYANNNPVMLVDPDGHWVWLAINAGFAVYDGYKAYKSGKGWKGVAAAAAIGFVGGGKFKLVKNTGKFSKYGVGLYKEIKGVPGLDAHHVGQKAIMKKFIRNYDPNNAPAILVPKAGHTRKGPRGIVSRSSKGIESARQLLARDIMELRRVYPDIPNSQLRKLIELNKQLYPEMRRR